MDQRVILDILDAGHGDCLWLEYGPAATPRRMLVDAGTRTTATALMLRMAEVRGREASHRLLVITHVDADHIAGALPLLADPAVAAQFTEIWFNGRKHLDRAVLEDFGPAQGDDLTDLIRTQQLAWNSSFQGQAVALSTAGQPVRMSVDEWLDVTILSPADEQLRRLARVWDRETRSAGLRPQGRPAPEPAHPPHLERMGSLNVAQVAREPFNEDASAANGSSIAFLAEVNGRSILFGADAHPSVLIASLRQLNGGSPVPVDVFKLPHHGSQHNVTRELLELAPADCYVFSTNGQIFNHPDQQAVARTICYGKRGSTLAFNCRSAHNAVWDDDNLRRRWQFQTLYGEDGLGITVDLSRPGAALGARA